MVATLTDGAPQTVGAVEGDSIGDRDGAVFPPYTPIAIIERASSSDQRMVASTLEGIVEALEGCGEQRPPGMMLIGWSVLALEGRGDVTIQDDGMSSDGEELEKRDRQRVAAWLKGRRVDREGGVGPGRIERLGPRFTPARCNLLPRPWRRHRWSTTPRGETRRGSGRGMARVGLHRDMRRVYLREDGWKGRRRIGQRPIRSSTSRIGRMPRCRLVSASSPSHHFHQKQGGVNTMHCETKKECAIKESVSREGARLRRSSLAE